MADLIQIDQEGAGRRKSRRAFLKRAGGVAGAASLLIAGCDSGYEQPGLPRAAFSFSPETPDPGVTVQFTDESTDPDGQIVDWLWEFGDGETSSDPNPTHAYAEPGSYPVTLTVSDDSELSTAITKAVVVPAPADAVITIDVSGDFGVLNYAYALEQLEAAFYETALAQGVINDAEVEEYLTDLAEHEGAHRDFFATAIPAVGGEAIPPLTFDFSGVNFLSQNTILATAQVLEDTGVAAYNGAASYLTTPAYLALAGKIVSVEARHAAAIRSMVGLSPYNLESIDRGSVPASGLDAALPPDEIFAAVAATGFLVSNVEVTGV